MYNHGMLGDVTLYFNDVWAKNEFSPSS